MKHKIRQRRLLPFPIEKACTKCHVVKRMVMFHTDLKCSDNHSSWCAECYNAASKAYYRANREHQKLLSKQNRAKDPEKANARAKVWREANPERFAAKSAQWQRDNPERVIIFAQRHAARRAGLPSTLTLTQWNDTLEQFNNRCAYCGTDGKMQQEHCMPVILGGGYTQSNIVPACTSCNHKKGMRTAVEFIFSRSVLQWAS